MMIKIASILKVLSLGLCIELLLVVFPTQVKSQTEFRTTNIAEKLIFQENFDPPGDGKPKDTVGAGSRSGLKCVQDEQSIRPLMPKRNYGLTLEEHPTVFVYLPNTSAKRVVLTFQDETGNSSERVFLAIASGRGIASFRLPDNQSPLTIGKNYQWSLAVVCGETLQPSDPVFRGWVQRVARTANSEQKSLLAQMQWYGKNGYWYDLLKVMMQVKRTQPNDASMINQWREILQSVGLGEIASEILK
jgi:Domain of Unknown Function (DUF928)